MYEVKKIDNSRQKKKKNDNDMMNLPKSLHGEDMSLIDGMMNDIDSEPLGEDQSSHVPLIKSQSKHMILGS